MVERCVASIRRVSRYRRFEIIVADRNTMPPIYGASLGPAAGVRRVTYDEPFNWSRVNNLAARHAAGDHLLFLNDDTEAVEEEWLEAMLEFSQQPADRRRRRETDFPRRRVAARRRDAARRQAGASVLRLPGQAPGLLLSQPAAAQLCGRDRRLPDDPPRRVRKGRRLRRVVPAQLQRHRLLLRVRQLGYRVVYTPHARVVASRIGRRSPASSRRNWTAFRARWGKSSIRITTRI